MNAPLDPAATVTRAEVEAAVDEISAMKATRVWRFGTSFWAARDRILGPRRG